jgi:hypothetical protein
MERIMTEKLEQLIEAARHARPTEEQMEAQRRSFAYGNTAFENPAITRELIDREAERLAAEHISTNPEFIENASARRSAASARARQSPAFKSVVKAYVERVRAWAKP